QCIPQNYPEIQSPISRRQRRFLTLSRTLPNELINETHQLPPLKKMVLECSVIENDIIRQRAVLDGEIA
ncbi:hypothetical protein N7537_008767, partial [Penicillium hordei]